MDSKDEQNLRKVSNFSGNQSWYSVYYAPATEAEVLDILSRHPGATIRAVGSGHSWSDVAANADIALDLSALNSVMPMEVEGRNLVRVGGGCRIQHLLNQLYAMTGRTLPTIGAIKKQTVAGAISTGTHGSGSQSLSHFVASLRAATFDAVTGQPVVSEFSAGPELLAARCGLGCVGIILSVDLYTVPKYMVAETIRTCQSIEEVMAAFGDNPLSYFVLSPYGWKLSVFERKLVETGKTTLGSTIKAWFFRVYCLFVLDIGFHVGVHASRVLGPWAIRAFQKIAPAALIRNCERVDDAEQVLTTHHYLFHHEEMEIFVSESDLPRALQFLRASINHFAGLDASWPAETLTGLTEAGLDRILKAKRGSYTHHYPLACRRVLPDETMISMTADAPEPMFSISVFTYDPAGHRDAYHGFCSFLARSLLKLLNAKLHWGKHFPLAYADIAPLYSRLDEFRALCVLHDRNGVLRNGYTARVLNLSAGSKVTG